MWKFSWNFANFDNFAKIPKRRFSFSHNPIYNVEVSREWNKKQSVAHRLPTCRKHEIPNNKIDKETCTIEAGGL